MPELKRSYASLGGYTKASTSSFWWMQHMADSSNCNFIQATRPSAHTARQHECLRAKGTQQMSHEAENYFAHHTCSSPWFTWAHS
eukprot:1155705-Pelagomonas_calceolata.AAC.2